MSDEDLKILADDLLDFLDGLEASIVKMKMQLNKLFGEAKAKFSWNPDKIVWSEAEGSHGKYERSEDVNNPEFKEMLKDLASHNGKLSRNGFFYWSFPKSAIVGRKKREAKR